MGRWLFVRVHDRQALFMTGRLSMCELALATRNTRDFFSGDMVRYKLGSRRSSKTPSVWSKQWKSTAENRQIVVRKWPRGGARMPGVNQS